MLNPIQYHAARDEAMNQIAAGFFTRDDIRAAASFITDDVLREVIRRAQWESLGLIIWSGLLDHLTRRILEDTK